MDLPANITPRLRKALDFAREEAWRLHCTFVGTEHLLLGLLRLEHGHAVNMLTRMGVDLEALYLEAQAITGPGALLEMPELTPRSRHVLRHAAEETERLNCSLIGTGQVLIGLLLEPEGVAGRLLVQRGIRVEEARKELRKELGHSTGEGKGIPSSEVLRKAKEIDQSRISHSSLDKITAEYLQENLLLPPDFAPKQAAPSDVPQEPKPLPPITGELVVPERMMVRELAGALGRKPFQIIADLMEIGVFANVNQFIEFETIAKVARRHGLQAKREE